MSIFVCARCRQYTDSDDGCDETADGRLICLECVEEMLADINPKDPT